MVGCFGKTNGDFALDSIVELNVNGFVSNGTGVALVDVGFGWIIPNRLLKDLFDVRDETVDGAFGVNDGWGKLVAGGIDETGDSARTGFMPRYEGIVGGGGGGGDGAAKIWLNAGMSSSTRFGADWRESEADETWSLFGMFTDMADWSMFGVETWVEIDSSSR